MSSAPATYSVVTTSYGANPGDSYYTLNTGNIQNGDLEITGALRVDGATTLVGPVTCDGTLTAGATTVASLSAGGNVTASSLTAASASLQGALTAAGSVTAASVTATGAVSAASVASSGALTAGVTTVGALTCAGGSASQMFQFSSPVYGQVPPVTLQCGQVQFAAGPAGVCGGVIRPIQQNAIIMLTVQAADQNPVDNGVTYSYSIDPDGSRFYIIANGATTAPITTLSYFIASLGNA
jgi:hypothetical protein